MDRDPQRRKWSFLFLFLRGWRIPKEWLSHVLVCTATKIHVACRGCHIEHIRLGGNKAHRSESRVLSTGKEKGEEKQNKNNTKQCNATLSCPSPTIVTHSISALPTLYSTPISDLEIRKHQVTRTFSSRIFHAGDRCENFVPRTHVLHIHTQADEFSLFCV